MPGHRCTTFAFRCCQTASRAVIAQAVPLASSATAICSDQPTVGSWASQRYQREFGGERAEFVGRHRPVVDEIADRRQQPPCTEPPGRRAAPAAVGAAAGAGPRDPRECRGRLESGDPGVPDAERADRRADVAFDARHVEMPVRADEPRLDELADRELDVVVESLGVVGLDRRSSRRRRSGEVGHRELGAGVGVGGERVRRLPRLEFERQVEHRREIAAIGRPPRRAAPVRGRRTPPAARDRARATARPTCGAARRPRSAARSVNRPDSPSLSSSTAATNAGRGEQRQSELGQRRRRPELAAGVDGVARSVPHAQQARPVTAGAAVVDHPHEPVEVGPMDQPVEVVVRAWSYSLTSTDLRSRPTSAIDGRHINGQG